jgi:hypothetical protein
LRLLRRCLRPVSPKFYEGGLGHKLIPALPGSNGDTCLADRRVRNTIYEILIVHIEPFAQGGNKGKSKIKMQNSK